MHFEFIEEEYFRFEDVPLEKQDEVWNKAHIPQTKEEINAKLLQMKVQGILIALYNFLSLSLSLSLCVCVCVCVRAMTGVLLF